MNASSLGGNIDLEVNLRSYLSQASTGEIGVDSLALVREESLMDGKSKVVVPFYKEILGTMQK